MLKRKRKRCFAFGFRKQQKQIEHPSGLPNYQQNYPKKYFFHENYANLFICWLILVIAFVSDFGVFTIFKLLRLRNLKNMLNLVYLLFWRVPTTTRLLKLRISLSVLA